MIIGLSGYARSGKDEAARALVESGYEQKAFADKLREFLYTLNPILHPGSLDENYPSVRVRDVVNTYTWDGYKETPYGPEIRELLQRLGTDCGRALLGDSVWVNATLRGNYAANLVVTDCRFPNEARTIEERFDGRVIRIVRPGVGPANDHPSETALDDWDFYAVIHNDGTIDELHNKIRKLARDA